MSQIDIAYTRAVQNTTAVQHARAAQAENQINSEKPSLISKFAGTIFNFLSELWTDYQTNRASIRSSQAYAEQAIISSDDELTNNEDVESRIGEARSAAFELLHETR